MPSTGAGVFGGVAVGVVRLLVGDDWAGGRVCIMEVRLALVALWTTIRSLTHLTSFSSFSIVVLNSFLVLSAAWRMEWRSSWDRNYFKSFLFP